MPKRSVEIKGVDALSAAFKELPQTVLKRAGNRGVTKAAASMRKELRSAAPKKTGELRKDIKTIGLRGGPRAQRSRVGKRVALDSLFYYETLEHGRKPSDRAAGSPQMKRFAFWHSTVDRNAQRVSQMIVDSTQEALSVEAKKYYQQSLRNGR